MNNRRNELLLVSAKEYCKCVVEGKTIKYNQQANIVQANATGSGVITTISNNIITIQPTTGNRGALQGINIISGHKYFYRLFVKQNYTAYSEIRFWNSTYASTFGLTYGTINENVLTKREIIATANFTDSNTNISFYASQGRPSEPTDKYEVYNLVIIDLTALGLDNITTAKQFYETDLGEYILNGNYLPYEPDSKFMHAQTPINFKGVNVWNEQYRGGCYDTTNGDYNPSSSDYEICLKDKIRVKPNTKYYVYCGKAEIANFAVFYDKNNNYLGYFYYVANANYNEYIIKTPANAYYMGVTFGTDYGTTYLHDICISENVWNENWEIGAINTGTGNNNDVTNNSIRSADYIKIEPSQKYYFSSSSHHCSAFFYGKNKEYLGDKFIIGDLYNNYFVSPKNAYYMRFYTWEGNTYNNDIVIFYYGYQRYCGTNVLMKGLVLQKGDSYKSWGLDKVSYNNQNSMPNGTITGWSVIASANVVSGHKYLIHNVYSRQSQSQQDADYQVYIDGLIDERIYNINATKDSIIVATQTGTCYFNSATYDNYISGVQYYIAVIDLTLLGLDNITSVADFSKTKLGMFLSKGYYLPYTTTNKTIKDQLVRTMKEIDLSTLAWTWEGDYWDTDISNIDDIKKDYQSDETPNAIAEKYRVVSVNQDTQEGYPVGNLIIEGSEFTGYYIEINSNDSQNAPSGKMLIELLQPTLVMWQTLNIQDYSEFVTTDTSNIFKLNRDLSDYGVLDLTSDVGTKMSNLTQLNISGGNGDFCYQDGYIYQKTDDIENAWIYQIQISNAPSRMVSRRTINVESENEIDLDFTKE